VQIVTPSTECIYRQIAEVSKMVALRGATVFVLTFLVGCNVSSAPVFKPAMKLVPRAPRPVSGEPTTSRMVLRYRNGEFTIVASYPMRSQFRVVNASEYERQLRAGILLLVDFRITGPAGTSSGSVLFPLKGEVEYLHPTLPHRIVKGEDSDGPPVATVIMPYPPIGSTITFTRAEPSATADPKEWKRVAAGNDIVTREKEVRK
jgi:hypothetical protein